MLISSVDNMCFASRIAADKSGMYVGLHFIENWAGSGLPTCFTLVQKYDAHLRNVLYTFVHIFIYANPCIVSHQFSFRTAAGFRYQPGKNICTLCFVDSSMRSGSLPLALLCRHETVVLLISSFK